MRIMNGSKRSPCAGSEVQSPPAPPVKSPVDGHKKWVRLETDGMSPSPRSGHDVVVIDGKAYLFGGCGGEQDQITCLNDVFVFDLTLHRWAKVAVKGDIPLPRASFGMCGGPTPNTLIVAGGTGVEMDSLRADVVQYDTKSRTWTKVLTDSEETPCKFYGQSVCTYKDTLLLFGGSTGLHYSNELYEYNMRTNRWKKLVTKGVKPSPRYKHQTVVVGHNMYVLGGGCFKPEQSTIDLYCLNLLTKMWTTPVMEGDIPKARVAHSCSYDEEAETIYLWGGFTSELSRLQDFYAFHCPTATWFAVGSELQTASEATTTRTNGGRNSSSSSSSSSDSNSNNSSPGSSNSSGRSNAPTETATANENDKQLPPARAFHSAVFHDGSLYVFSGANGDVRYSDVWRYRVRSSPPSLTMLAAHALKRDGRVTDKEGAKVGLSKEVVEVVMAPAHAGRATRVTGRGREAVECSPPAWKKSLEVVLPQELLYGVSNMNAYAERLC